MTSKRQSLLTQAATQIRKANSVLLACHLGPDADALGSLLGLTLGLERLGKQTYPVSPDGVPELYRFLPGWERVHAGAPDAARRWDLGIGLDADGAGRLGVVAEAVLAQPVVLDIDHHTSPERYGTVQVVDSTAAATGELVYELLVELGVEVDADIAACLLAAILTDTGSFRFSNVTARTFEIAAALVRAGAHPTPLFEAVYGSRPYESSRLLGRLLSRLEVSDDGLIVWGALTRDDFRETDASSDATEGFVEQIRMVAGGEVAVFCREAASGEIRVSLRSRGAVNVARVAEEFGGGGHVPAAGCTLQPPLADAVRRVVAAVRRRIDEAPASVREGA